MTAIVQPGPTHEPNGPMSFGFSFADIIKAGQIAKQIKDVWFTRLNRAGLCTVYRLH